MDRLNFVNNQEHFIAFMQNMEWELLAIIQWDKSKSLIFQNIYIPDKKIQSIPLYVNADELIIG